MHFLEETESQSLIVSLNTIFCLHNIQFFYLISGKKS